MRAKSILSVGAALAVLVSLYAAYAATRESVPSVMFEEQARPVLAKAGAVESRDPKLAMRASGALYMLAVYRDGAKQNRLGLFTSMDGGDSFEPPSVISAPDADVNSHGENSPSLAFGTSTETYALWEQRVASGTDLMFARSTMMGRPFDKPVRVTDKTEPSTNAFSSLAVAPSGEVYAVWLDGRNPEAGPPGTFSVFLAKSTDRGATFGSNVEIAGGACPCCRPVIAFGARGEVHVSWRHVFEGNIRDMALATSRDGGSTFDKPVRVAIDGWKINGCPHCGAGMVTHKGTLYIAWHSEGSGGNPGIRLASSVDGGRTFTDPILVSKGLVDTNHPALQIAGDGRIVLVFQARDGAKDAGWSPSGVWMVTWDAAGKPGAPVAVPGNRKAVSYPFVLPGTLGRTYIAWTESGEQGRQVMLVRGRLGQ